MDRKTEFAQLMVMSMILGAAIGITVMSSIYKEVVSTELQKHTKDTIALVEHVYQERTQSMQKELFRLRENLQTTQIELEQTTTALWNACFIPESVHRLYPCVKVFLFPENPDSAAVLLMDTGQGIQRISLE